MTTSTGNTPTTPRASDTAGFVRGLLIMLVLAQIAILTSTVVLTAILTRWN